MPERVVFRAHALRRMFERHISVDQVRSILAGGETILYYSDDRPYPSRLMLGWSAGRPLHVVVADTADATKIVITVYEPDPNRWDDAFRQEAVMLCTICGQAEPAPGTATVTLERGPATVVVKHVPADVCPNCGEEYISDDVGARLLAAAEEAARRGVRVDVREYAA